MQYKNKYHTKLACHLFGHIQVDRIQSVVPLQIVHWGICEQQLNKLVKCHYMELEMAYQLIK